MLRIAVCDDEKNMLEFLHRQLADVLQTERVDFHIDTYADAETLHKAHMECRYDVLFLDICMPETSGFELAESVRSLSQKTSIVFVTANDNLVFESMQYQPFYFIRKNSTDNMKAEIAQTVKKLLKRMRQYTVLELQSAKEGAICVTASEIIYVESRGHYLYYVLTTGKLVTVRGQISEAEAMLRQYDFLRVHKSYIVNMNHIRTVEKTNSELVLSRDIRLRIGRMYLQSTVQGYMEFVRRTCV